MTITTNGDFFKYNLGAHSSVAACNFTISSCVAYNATDLDGTTIWRMSSDGTTIKNRRY